MQYLNTRKLFLFDMVNEHVSQLDLMDDECNYAEIITNANKFFMDFSKRFIEKIFKIVYDHVNQLELNIFAEDKTLSINHVKNIYRGILSNSSIKKFSENIKNKANEINQRETFDIREYGQLMDYVEELDFICTFEMYSYLLREDVEGVLSFILDKVVEEAVYMNQDIENVNRKILSQINRKINIFKDIYDDEEISIIEETKNHIIYKINQVLHMFRV